MPPIGETTTRFVADAMLGSLARKLRALGFDTAYYRSGDDSGIMALAALSGRIMLTADRSLASLASGRGLKAVLLVGTNDNQRVRAIAKAASDMGFPLTRGASLCSLCGSELERVRRVEVKGQVPPSVEIRHRVFYRCVSCKKLYWRGSHWKKLRSLGRELKMS
jgi:uncharacterized protein with PIN domain